MDYHYQLTEYDCGTAAVINALCCLLEPDKITYEMIRKIITTIPDLPNNNNISSDTFLYLTTWLNNYSNSLRIPLLVKYYQGANAYSCLTNLNYDISCAVTRLDDHYILVTGMEIIDHTIFFKIFDSDKRAADKTITDKTYNRRLPVDLFVFPDREQIKTRLPELLIFMHK